MKFRLQHGLQISKFKFQNIIFGFILVLAAFLRLYRIQDYMTFLGDEGRDVLVAYNILHGHLTLLGPTSSVGGFFLGPIYYYFISPFLWLFNYNPVGPAVMVALFGIATVFLIYKIGKEFFNENVGLISSFLYAISPLIIIYSHSSWNPNILPFFSLSTLYVLYRGLLKNNLKLILFSGLLFGICMQLHYLALFLGVVIFFYILLNNFSNALKNYLSFFVGFLIGWSPFLAFEIRHGFLDFKNIYNFVLHSGNTGTNLNFFATVYDVFFRLFGRLIFSFSGGAIEYIFVLIFVIFSTIFLFFQLHKSYKEKSQSFRRYLLLALWLFFGVSLFGLYKKEIYDYYFAFMFPLPFFLIGIFLDFIYKSRKYQNFGKILVLVVIALVVILDFSTNVFLKQPNRQLNQMRTIADFVMTKTDAKLFNFALISGGNSDHAYRYFFTIWNHPPVTIQDPKHDPKRATVTNQLFVVCESLPCEPLGNSLWEIAGFGRAEIAGHWKVSVVEVYRLVHYIGR